MKQERGKTESSESKPPATDRRAFLGKSLGAVPIVLTVSGGSSLGGGSVHGTLWSSVGTRWRHRGRWWRGGGWDREEPPPFENFEDPPRRGENEARPDWDWQAPREDWRKWRPDVSSAAKPGWQWGTDKSDPIVPTDLPPELARPK